MLLGCSREIFSADELQILEEYGDFMLSLECGKRSPTTEAQRRFVQVCAGQVPPQTPYELVWTKYQARCRLERDPAHQRFMGPKWKDEDDRDDWKTMRARTAAEVRNRR